MANLKLLLAVVMVGAIAPKTAPANPHTACTDCPTPNPCAAEGACRPRRATWGYYQNTWNRWPTDYDASTRAKAAVQGEQRFLLPEKEVEDQAAPAPTRPEAAEESSLPSSGNESIDLPDLPPLPGINADPAGPADDDPPPGLPPLPGFGAPPGIGPPPSASIQPIRTPARQQRELDGPPALPASLAHALGKQPGRVTQASVPAVLPATQEPVSPAYYRPQPVR